MFTNKGTTRLLSLGLAALTAPHWILLDAAQVVPDFDDNFVSDLTEFAGTGYTGGFAGAGRQAAGSLAANEDDTNDLAELDDADPSFAGITDGRIAPVMALVDEVTNDAASPIICFVPLFINEGVPTAASEANPAEITIASHGLSTGDLVYIVGFAGGTWDTELNGKWFQVTSTGANTFTLDGVNSSAFGTATFATAKVYRPLTMNGATVTPNLDAAGFGNAENILELA